MKTLPHRLSDLSRLPPGLRAPTRRLPAGR